MKTKNKIKQNSENKLNKTLSSFAYKLVVQFFPSIKKYHEPAAEVIMKFNKRSQIDDIINHLYQDYDNYFKYFKNPSDAEENFFWCFGSESDYLTEISFTKIQTFFRKEVKHNALILNVYKHNKLIQNFTIVLEKPYTNTTDLN